MGDASGTRVCPDMSEGRPSRQAASRTFHCSQIFETWLNDSSTGVSRPKIETSTLSFCDSGLISLTEAGSVANGPSMTVTDSPISNSTAGPVGALTAAFLLSSAGLGARSLATSSRLSGLGLLDRPTKPVTPGVLRTAAQD